MTPARSTSGPPLGDFLAALQERWRGLSRDDLLAVLVGHAERLPVRDRQAFLDIFPDPAVEPPERAQSPTMDLLAGIDEFAARVAAGEYADDEEYYRDRYGWSDEEAVAWVPEADALFAATGDVFVAGDLDNAREAYQRLLAQFGPQGDDAWSLELWRLEDTDVPETLARYLRCVYQTTPADGRAEAVHQAYLDLPWSPSAPMLADLASTCREALSGLEAFLPCWIECLLSETGHPPLQQRVRLLAEAATLSNGVDGLAALARRSGPHQGGVGLARIDALAAAGRVHDAVAAAGEMLDLPHLDARQHAEAADRLADLHTRLANPRAAVQARRRAWTGGPTRQRLLALAGSSRDAGVLAETLAAEAGALDTTSRAGTDRLGCELLLLAGRLDQAIAALAGSEPLGWHRASHPGPIVLPFLWAAATGTAPTTDAGHLGQAFSAIDHDPDTLPRLEDWHQQAANPPTRADKQEPAGPRLTALLADVILRLPDDADDSNRWITTATTVVDARIHAIVSGKHRSAYARAASLAFAHAETLAAMDREAEAHAYLNGVRTRFPRHVAFRGELDAAAGTSTLDVRQPSRTQR